MLRNVLIVDDDLGTRELLTAVLSGEGYHVVVAEDGLEGLHMLRIVRHRAPDVPCLVLLDLAMPRLGGFAFRRAQLRDPRVATVPVVVISGAVDLEKRTLSMGAVAVVPKPINFDVLIDVVQRYCSLGGLLRVPADGLTHG